MLLVFCYYGWPKGELVLSCCWAWKGDDPTGPPPPPPLGMNFGYWKGLLLMGGAGGAIVAVGANGDWLLI